MISQLPFSTILVIGNWGVGKTRFLSLISPMVAKETGIKQILFDSDRFYFEDAVRRDTAGKTPEADGSFVGPHSVMVADGPKGQMLFRALDGSIFNEAHRRMLASLKDQKAGVIRLVEYATGPSTAFGQGELLDQSAHFVAENLIASGAVPTTLVVELSAPFDIRKRRNAIREDKVDEKAFELYGQPGGGMTEEDASRLGLHFIHVENHTTGLETLVARVFYEHIQPNLLCEGQSSTLRRDRR
jgi:hypothetical protein